MPAGFSLSFASVRAPWRASAFQGFWRLLRRIAAGRGGAIRLSHALSSLQGRCIARRAVNATGMPMARTTQGRLAANSWATAHQLRPNLGSARAPRPGHPLYRRCKVPPHPQVAPRRGYMCRPIPNNSNAELD
jgi:hypothetical protein